MKREVITLPGKDVSSVSSSMAVGATYDGRGFAVFIKDNEVKNEIVLDEPADFVSCEETMCAFVSGEEIFVTSEGGVVKRFPAKVPITWLLLFNNMVITTSEEEVRAYSLEGNELWVSPLGPSRGVAELKGKLYVGTPYGVAVLDTKGNLLREVELGTGNWRVTSSCSAGVLVQDEENAIAMLLLGLKDLGEPEPLGTVTNVVGVPWASPDCAMIAVPKCGVRVSRPDGTLEFEDEFEGSDECVGVWTHWGDDLKVAVSDEGLWRSYVLVYSF